MDPVSYNSQPQPVEILKLDNNNLHELVKFHGIKTWAINNIGIRIIMSDRSDYEAKVRAEKELVVNFELFRLRKTTGCIEPYREEVVSKGLLFKIPNTKKIEDKIKDLYAKMQYGQVLLNGSPTPKFADLYFHADLPKTEVFLLKGDKDDLIWQVYYKTLGLTAWCSYKEATIISPRCYSLTAAFIERMKKDKLISYFKNGYFTVYDGRPEWVTEVDSPIKGKQIVLEMIKEYSIRKHYSEYCKHHLKYIAGIDKNSCLDRMGVESYELNQIPGSKDILHDMRDPIDMPQKLEFKADYESPKFDPLLPSRIKRVERNVASSHAVQYKPANLQFIQELEKKLSFEQSFPIILEPVSAKSQIDDRVLVSKFMWAVTIITGPEGKCGNHACLIIEGINDGYFKEKEENRYFAYLAHFVGDNTVKAKIVEENIKFEEASASWMTTKSFVKPMINAIEQEKRQNNIVSVHGVGGRDKVKPV